MATSIRIKRGTASQVSGVTPASGEPLWETDTERLKIGDGSTAGGLRVVMKADTDAADYGLSFEGVVTDAVSVTHFKVSTLAGKGAGFFIPASGEPYEIYVVQADEGAPEGEHTPVTAYDTSDGDFTHSALGAQLAVGDIVLIIHPWLARMLDLYTDWKEGGRLDSLIDDIITDIASAVPEPPTAKSLQDILHKDDSCTYTKSTDSLEAISDEIHATHAHVWILFVIPETGSPTDDNAILLIELEKLGHVHTITQDDALDFPAFGMYTLCVMGSNSGTAWTGTNLADLKTVIGLPLLTVDKVAAAYFKIGTAVTPDPTGKETIDVISEIAGTLMGIGEDSHEIITGLAAGLNTVSSDADYNSLDMSDADITGKVFACADNDPDETTSNEDVVMGLIPQVLEDGSIGKDEEGVDVAAAMGFLGFCYEGAKLTTLGKAAFKLFAHMMIGTKIASPLETPNAAVVDLRKRLLGNMKNNFTNTTPLVEWIAGEGTVGTKLPAGESLYDILLDVLTAIGAIGGGDATEAKQDIIDGYHDVPDEDVADDAQMRDVIGKKSDTTGGDSIVALIKILTAAIPAMVGTDNAATVADGWDSALATILDNFTSTRIGYLDQLDFNLNEAIAAIKTILDTPANFMANVASLALEATLGTPTDGDISTDIVNVQTVVDALDTLTKAAGDGDLAAMKTAIDFIVAAGPTNTQLNTAIALITTVTDNLPNSGALTDMIATLGAITAAGPTNTQMETARDAIIAAIPAMVGTDGAATTADGWDDALATILDNFNATRIGDLDELADANLPTDVANVKTDTGNIKTQTDKLAGASPSVGTATENWNAAEADIVSIGANDTKNKLHSLVLDISGLTATATITIRMYMQVNGNEKKVYDQDFVVGTDPDGLWIVNGMVGIHEVLRVTAESDDATDDGLDIAYDYMLEVM